jgi:hypothetical protein
LDYQRIEILEVGAGAKAGQLPVTRNYCDGGRLGLECSRAEHATQHRKNENAYFGQENLQYSRSTRLELWSDAEEFQCNTSWPDFAGDFTFGHSAKFR